VHSNTNEITESGTPVTGPRGAAAEKGKPAVASGGLRKPEGANLFSDE
jgi:hypothetical protein